MNYIINNLSVRYFLVLAIILLPNLGCKKYIQVDPPFTSINSENVFSEDATATAVLTDIYASISNSNRPLNSQGITNISLFAGLSADELKLYNLNNQSLLKYYRNNLDNLVAPNFWPTLYQIIYVANAAVEGCQKTTSLSSNVKKQLLGEAKFVRAFCYFYLINLYGDVPMVLSTDYSKNALLSRSSKDKVYSQVIDDLKSAQTLLSDDFLDGELKNVTDDRVRPTKWAASAMLARVFLFTGDYNSCIAQATKVMERKDQFRLVPLNEVFLKNSSEAIWQLQPVGIDRDSNTGDGAMFILPDSGPNNSANPVSLSDTLVASFEENDQRRSNWVDSVVVNGTVYYYAFKYKIPRINTDNLEYIMILRLSEVILIRSEAYAKMNMLSESAADLNLIRGRAGLNNITPANKNDMLTSILRERRVELFTEMGHRWIDLKRSDDIIDNIMPGITMIKGGNWNSNAKLYPLPLGDLQTNPNLIQNPGY